MMETSVGVRIEGMSAIRQLSIARLITLTANVRRAVCRSRSILGVREGRGGKKERYLVVRSHHVDDSLRTILAVFGLVIV